MKRAKPIVMALMLLSCSSFARADWVLVDVNPNGVKQYADSTSMKREGNDVRVLQKLVFPSTRFYSFMGSDCKSVHVTKLYQCASRKRSVTAIECYSADDKLLKKVDRVPLNWEIMKPGSVGENMLNFACNQ